jgi:hypothetical protein
VDGGNVCGGSQTLEKLIDQYGEFIAADLMETYRIDLRDIMRDDCDLSPRSLLVLIKHLPVTGRFYSEQRGGQQFRGWDESRYAMVATVNAIRALQYTYVAANSKRRPKQPEMFPIPEQKVRKRSTGPGSFIYMAATTMKKGGSNGRG